MNQTILLSRMAPTQPSFKFPQKEKRGYVVEKKDVKLSNKQEKSQSAAQALARLFGGD